MKPQILIPVALIIGASSTQAQSIGNLTFGYSNSTGELIQFVGTGDTFSFGHDVAGQGFLITDSNVPDLLNLKGSIDGSFKIDTAHISSGVIFGGITYDQAPVTNIGTPKLKIVDPFGIALTADVNWGDVFRIATTGSLNPSGNLNLSNFAYSGTYSPLSLLASSHTGSTNVTFQFNVVKTLNDLTHDGSVASATYSGSASTDAVIPEPSAYAAVLGFSALGLAAMRRRKSE